VAVAVAQKSIPKALFELALPIVGLNVLNVLMLAVDSALCGRLPNSQEALTALGFSIQVIFLLMVAMLGLLVGTVALVARAYGAGDTQRLNHLLIQSTQLTLIVGSFVGVIGAFAAEPILRVLGASHGVAELGAQYLRPLMLGTPFFYLGLLYAGILRGVGNTRIPFFVAIVANVVNAGLNYTLILGHFGAPALGVTGSALGTVCAQFLNVVILVVVLRRETIPNLKLPLRPRAIDHGLAGELYRIGWPAALDMLILNAGFLTALGMLGRIDEVTVAAHGLGLRVQSLAFVPGLGIAQATSAMIGQSLGGGSVERAKKIAMASLLMCTAIMTLLAIAITLAAHPLVHIFDVTKDPLEAYCVEWMYILGVAMIPAGANMAFIGLLQGSGATRISLRINFWSTIAIQVPLALVLAFVFHLDAFGVWLSFPIAFFAKAVLGYIAYKQEKWAVTGVRIPAHAAPAASAEH
jgi:putative MATE family efflux protein